MRILALLIFLSISGSAFAGQCDGKYAANQVCGSVAGGAPGPVTVNNVAGPSTIASVAHQWLNSYTASTGLFTQTQPACGDLSNGAASCSTDTTNAANISSGNLSTSRLNGGTGASSSTFWRGDGTWAAPSGGTNPLVGSFISSNWYMPYVTNGGETAAGFTAANTIYCHYVNIIKNVTIKALGLYVVTGSGATDAQLAIYSESGGTLTLVDDTASIATTSSSTFGSATVANTTDNLTAGTLYAFCSNSNSTAQQVANYGSNDRTQASLIGSATGSSVINSAVIVGRSLSETFGTWPGTITESSMSDVAAGGTVPMVAFEVN